MTELKKGDTITINTGKKVFRGKVKGTVKHGVFIRWKRLSPEPTKRERKEKWLTFSKFYSYEECEILLTQGKYKSKM